MRCHRLKEQQNFLGTILQKSVALLWRGEVEARRDDRMSDACDFQNDDAHNNRSSFFNEKSGCISRNGHNVVRLYKKGRHLVY